MIANPPHRAGCDSKLAEQCSGPRPVIHPARSPDGLYPITDICLPFRNLFLHREIGQAITLLRKDLLAKIAQAEQKIRMARPLALRLGRDQAVMFKRGEALADGHSGKAQGAGQTTHGPSAVLLELSQNIAFQ